MLLVLEAVYKTPFITLFKEMKYMAIDSFKDVMEGKRKPIEALYDNIDTVDKRIDDLDGAGEV
jgi:hypothetical protein